MAGLPVRDACTTGCWCILSLTIVGGAEGRRASSWPSRMLIAPGAIAFLLTKRFEMMMVIAVSVASISSFLGVYASFYLDSAPAPTIVLLMTVQFIAAFLASVVRQKRVEA